MRELISELSGLHLELVAGEWSPSEVERAAAAAIQALPELTTLGIRRGLDPARRTRSRLVTSMERVATVLSLPPIHEEAATREHLIGEAMALAQAVADSPAQAA